MATQLFINIQSSAIENALVRSVTDMTPVGFPELVIGDERDYELYFVDGVGGYASFSGNGSYIPNIAIGACGFPSGGTFTLTFSSQTTSALAWNISPAALQTALQGLSSIGSGNCSVAGVAGQYYIITFIGALAGTTQPEITADFSGLTPASTIDVSTIVAGGSGVNCVQLLSFSTNPLTFSDTWTPITNGWTGSLSTRTLELIEAFAAAGSSGLSETFQVTVADPSGNRLTYCKVPVSIVCTIIDPESFAGADKPLLATQAALNAAVLGLNNFTYENLSSSGAGNTNVTPQTTSRHHTARVSFTGTAGVRTISLLTSNSPNTGDTIILVLLPDSTSGNTLAVHNATSGGTLLLSITTDTSAQPVLALFVYNGSAWIKDFSTSDLLAKTQNLAGLSSTLTSKVNLATVCSQLSNKSTNFTITTADEGKAFLVSASGGSVTATLPSAGSAGAGFLLVIQKTDASTNPVITSPASVSLAVQNQSVLLASDGSNWNPVLQSNPSASLALSQVVQDWSFITDIAGSTPTSLNAQPTANGVQAARNIVMVTFGNDPEFWQLMAGTTATGAHTQRPTDYNASTNAVFWQLIRHLFQTAIITTTTTLDYANEVTVCNSSSAITVNLPPSPSTGEWHIIKNKNTGTVTLSGNGNNLFTNVSASTLSLLGGDSIYALWDGAIWNVVANVKNDIAYFQFQFSNVTALTAGSPADLVTLTFPARFARYLCMSAIFEATAASGTLAATTVDIRTSTGGGGSSILSGATALSSLTAANTSQVITPVLTSVLTATALTIRQTVNSANAGTLAGTLVLIPLP